MRSVGEGANIVASGIVSGGVVTMGTSFTGNGVSSALRHPTTSVVAIRTGIRKLKLVMVFTFVIPD